MQRKIYRHWRRTCMFTPMGKKQLQEPEISVNEERVGMPPPSFMLLIPSNPSPCWLHFKTKDFIMTFPPFHWASMICKSGICSQNCLSIFHPDGTGAQVCNSTYGRIKKIKTVTIHSMKSKLQQGERRQVNHWDCLALTETVSHPHGHLHCSSGRLLSLSPRVCHSVGLCSGSRKEELYHSVHNARAATGCDVWLWINLGSS